MRKFLLLSLVGMFLLLPGILNRIFAQTARPEFLITWEVQSYAPAEFKGKVFPSNGSPVLVSFELISPQGGLVDVSDELVYWYVNGKQVSAERGVQEIGFRAVTGDQEIKITLLEYPGGFLEGFSKIPSVQPEVAIEAPAGNVVAGPFRLKAFPYFFNVSKISDLNFFWEVNSKKSQPDESPDILKIDPGQDLPSGYALNVNLRVQPRQGGAGVAAKLLRLTFIK